MLTTDVPCPNYFFFKLGCCACLFVILFFASLALLFTTETTGLFIQVQMMLASSDIKVLKELLAAESMRSLRIFVGALCHKGGLLSCRKKAEECYQFKSKPF